jgi:hypothetical protein
MSDYTPTTEEVKANYALVGDDEVVNNINEQKFDRWLEQNNAEVTKSTEQRIVKLIEAEIERVSNPMLVDREYLDGLEMALELTKGEQISDSVEEGYKLLAKDPEIFQRRLLHHCGFDFMPDEAAAKCVCGAIATNPFWTVKEEQNPHVRAETRASTTLNTANIGNSARSCGCEGENNE